MGADADLSALEQQRCCAMLAGDVQALHALLAPDLRYVHSTGVVDSRDSLLARLGARQIAYRTLAFLPLRSTPGAHLGCVMGEMRATVMRGSEARQIAASYLAVWQLRDGQWQLAAYQGTALPGA